MELKGVKMVKYILLSLLLCSGMNLMAVFCPLCEHDFDKFLDYNHRENAKCPKCESLERQRLLWIFLKNNKSIFNKEQIRLLHFAPESCLQNKFSSMKNIVYIPVDLDPKKYQNKKTDVLKMDITDIKLPNNLIDLIVCIHVLEHIVDDRKAMAELFRVLKPNGVALLMIPLRKSFDKTYEDPTIISPEDRLKHFGQKDHVRIYGNDFITRLEETGFVVNVQSEKQLGSCCVQSNAIGDIFCCTKSSYNVKNKNKTR